MVKKYLYILKIVTKINNIALRSLNYFIKHNSFDKYGTIFTFNLWLTFTSVHNNKRTSLHGVSAGCHKKYDIM